MGLISRVLGNKCAHCGKRFREALLAFGIIMVCQGCMEELEARKRMRLEEEERRQRLAEEEAKVKAEKTRERMVEIRKARAENELSAAVSAGNLEAVRRLLGSADVNEPDWSGKTPLCVAAYGDAPRILELLIEKGAEVNAANGAGWTPLHFAAAAARTENAKFLLSHGADPNQSNRDDKTPLEIATGKGFSDLCKVLEG